MANLAFYIFAVIFWVYCSFEVRQLCNSGIWDPTPLPTPVKVVAIALGPLTLLIGLLGMYGMFAVAGVIMFFSKK